MKRHLMRGLPALVASAMCALPATGQTIAITNAKIYPVSGPMIERGTVVMKDGRILAVGASVAIPALTVRVVAR